LDGLEKDGLVGRHVHPEDRRKISVRLTARGRQVLEDMLPDYYRHIAKLMTNLTEKERLELMSLLGKVNQRLSVLFRE
jgi:DNA-binding MarR family transcriptional regulator